MYDKILAALELRAKELEDAPFIAFDNTRYAPKDNTPYIKTRFMPMTRRNIFLGLHTDGKPHRQEYTGLYQFLLNYPDATGSGATNRMVNEICDKFEATTDLEFEGVFVTIKHVERIRGINEGSWFKTPVHISWYSYTK